MSPNAYESKRYLAEYLVFHYARPRQVCPFTFVDLDWLRFQTRIREECLRPIPRSNQTRGLDLGCAVGRFTFELGGVVGRVLGIDNSRSFIRAARRMAKDHALAVPVHESGGRTSTYRLVLPKPLRQAQVAFQVGDAQKVTLPAEGPYDVVTAINLLDRLPSPRRFLQQIASLVAPGGQFVMASPFTWLEEYTPRREWLTSKQAIALLRPGFRLAQRRDLPFLIREHRRKYQLGISEVLTFVRRE